MKLRPTLAFAIDGCNVCSHEVRQDFTNDVVTSGGHSVRALFKRGLAGDDMAARGDVDDDAYGDDADDGDYGDGADDGEYGGVVGDEHYGGDGDVKCD